MNFVETGFKELYIIEIQPLHDDRGFFSRTFCKNEFKKINFSKEFVQINLSFNSAKGTLRGMHYQLPPHEEIKLIRCNAGKVFDVVVDMRKHSDTYLKWFSCELSRENNKMILIPSGFAHGFITLEDNTELIYHHTEFYNPSSERGLRYDDERFNIEWPIKISNISEKDRSYPKIKLTT